jgi:hypothetical protein
MTGTHGDDHMSATARQMTGRGNRAGTRSFWCIMAIMATTPRQGARKVAGDTELREIAAAGAGFIIDPFNRWWHFAGCQRVAAMTTGQPKWYAATAADREAFLEQRLARLATAQPVLPCRACGADAAPPRLVFRPASRAVGPQPPEPCTRRSDGGFEVWADQYVRNDSVAGSAAGLLRRLIAREVRALPASAGLVLHAGYGGQRRPGADVENLLFNNIDQTLALFRRPGALGAGFEDLGLAIPPAPDGTTRQCYYRYGLAQPGAAFAAVRPGQLVCRVPEAVIPDGPARLAARIWLAVRRARPLPPPGVPAGHGSFLLRITVHQLSPAGCIKAIVDGATAAMQSDDPARVAGSITRLSRLLDADPRELLALVTTADAPLGTRSRSSPASRHSLFTLDGPAQVRVTPDDDRCIAAEVISGGMDGPARLSVEVYSAAIQP